MQPYSVVRDFEQALCEYTGSKFAVTTNSCTMALLLACKWCFDYQQVVRSVGGITIPDSVNTTVTIPKYTYCSVPMSIINAGGRVQFNEDDWWGTYQLKPYPIFDSARRFTSNMYLPGTFMCVSFHSSKILADIQGGAILHDNDEADKWFRKARFDGRTEGVAPKDDNLILGYHCYMSPDVAARLLLKLSVLPEHNADLPNSDYPDLSKQEIFQ